MRLGKHVIILPFIPPHKKFTIIFLSFFLGMIVLISFDETPEPTEMAVQEVNVEQLDNG